MDILSGTAVLAVGVVIGIGISRWFTLPNSRSSTLSRQLDEVHAEYAAYQDKVDQHFRKTADLLNALSSNYGAIHQHLALGVQTLSQRNLSHVAQQHILPLESPFNDDDAVDAAQQHYSSEINEQIVNNPLNPPKDYAPKSASDPGMLSDDRFPQNIKPETPKD